MKFKQHLAISFKRKIRISLALMAVLPLLLIVYLLILERINFTESMVLFGVLILVSMALGYILLRDSSKQLCSLVRETSSLLGNKSPEQMEIEADDELRHLADNFNKMVDRLSDAQHNIQVQSIQLLEYAQDLAASYERLRREEEVRAHLCRYIGGDVVEKLLDIRSDMLLENQRRPLTVMFADIRGFTAIAERMETEEVVAMLNQYFSAMVGIVFRFNGLLDKFVGDQIMAVFGHITSEKEGARDAVEAALHMQRAAVRLMASEQWRVWPKFQIGIGINTGMALIGNVGSENRMDYTVIGDTVNAAARLEKHARGREIIIGEQTCLHLPKRIMVGERAELQVKNRSRPVICYKVLGDRNREGKPAKASERTVGQRLAIGT